MPVSAVAVTEGSGKNLHTWQRSVASVNREEQYVQLGEPGLPSFILSASTISTATSDSHLVQLMAGSSSYVRILAVEVWQVASAGTAATSEVRICRLSTAGTGGSAEACYQLDAADTATATGMSLPTSKGTESAYPILGSIRLDTTGTGSWSWRAEPRSKPLVIAAGTANGIAVKLVTGVASATVAINVTFTETAWL